MKTTILILVLMLSVSLYGQHYEYGNLDTTIYNPETGQYWYRSTTFKESQNIFSAEEFFFDGEMFRRFRLEGTSSLNEIPFGFYALASYERPILKPEWKESGYIIRDKDYYLTTTLAIRYEKNGLSPFVGVGYLTGKKSFGVSFGFIVKKEKWESKCLFYYSTICAYEKEVVPDPELPEEIRALMSPIVIKGFDPNSWYKVSFKYQMSENKYLGIISERFYGSRLFYEYQTNATGLHFQDLNFILSMGRDLEFKHNLLSVGLRMSVF